MELLIYGGNGWIGNQFVTILKERNINCHISALRVDNTEEIIKK